jgi:hypothetical protein
VDKMQIDLRYEPDVELSRTVKLQMLCLSIRSARIQLKLE